MRLGPEKQDDVRGRCVFANGSGKGPLLPLRLMPWHFPVNQKCPGPENSGERHGQSDHGHTANLHVGGLPEAFRDTPKQQGETGVRGEEVIGPLELGA